MFVDYGCADGSLLKFINNIFPEYKYIGYDISEDMINLAKKDNKSIIFTTKWDEVSEQIHNCNQPKVLILSSIIHEIYSYGNINEFWDRVFNSGFDYIVIRDMMVSKESERLTEINDIIKILNSQYNSNLYEFENYWGGIKYNKNFLHYLLKYRYMVNWEREVKENYLPIIAENLLLKIPQQYEVIFYEHYLLPFLKQQVKADFDIDLKDNTHIKMIIKKRVGGTYA
jgi:hypothetical protein